MLDFSPVIVYNEYIKRTKEINNMFKLTTITFNGYFLGTVFAYLIGSFITFFTHGTYSVQMLWGDLLGGLVCILFSDMIATQVWNIKKAMEEED